MSLLQGLSLVHYSALNNVVPRASVLTRITPIILLWLLCLSTPVYPVDVLIASGHVEYPPFMYRQGDKIIGVGPDLTTMIFNELGITVDSKYVGSWNRVQRKAEAGEIDLIVGIYKTAVREKYLSYPDEPYVEEPVGIFVQRGNLFKFDRWQDLIGKKGGTVMGESFGQDFDAFALKNLKLQHLSGITQSFKMIERNRLDYSIYALYPGLIKVIEAGMENKIDQLPNPVAKLPAYQAISKKSKYLVHLPYFNKRLIALKADGTVAALIDKHMLLLRRKRR